MNFTKNLPVELSNLRQKAEKLLKEKSTENEPKYSETDVLKLIHEHEVYQIELELQNEELLQSISDTADAVNLYDFAPSGYFTLSKTGEIIRLNFNGANMLGKERRQLIRSNFNVFVSSDFRPDFNLFFGKVFNSLVKQSCEVALLADDGSLMYVQLSGIVTKNKEQCLVTAVDITELKRTEEALKKSQLLLESSLESQKDTILLSIDRDYRYLYFNKAHSDVMKYVYNMDIRLGMNLLECITSDKDRETARENYDRALKGESHSNIGEYGDVEFAWFESFFNPIVNEKNEIIGATALARNITERRQTEEVLKESEVRFRKLLQDMQFISVQGYAPDGTTQYWNRASERLYGYTAEEAIGRNLLDLIIPPEMREGVKQAMKQMAETGQPIPSSELILMHKDGSRIPVFSSHTIIQVPGQPQELFCIDIDLTELKKAEESLRLSDELLSLFLKYSPVFAFIKEVTSTESRVLKASEGLEDVIGISGSYMSGKTMEELFPAEFAAKITADDVYVVSEGKELRLDEEINGRYFSSIKYPIPQEGKNLLAGYKIDITERKLVEEELRKSKKQYDNLVAKIPVGVYILRSKPDESFKLDYVSPKMGEILNLSCESIMADATLVVQSIHPEDRDSFSVLNLEGIQLNRPFDWTGRILIEGIVRWMHFRSYPELQEDGDILWHGLVVDITERKRADEFLVRSEAKFRMLAENMKDVVWVLDTGLQRFTYVSPSVIKLRGYTAEEIMAESMDASFLPDQLDALKEMMGQRIETFLTNPDVQGQYYTEELQQPCKDGTNVWIEVVYEYYLNKETNHVELHGVTRDISERKKAEQEIQLKNEELSQLVAQKDKLFSIIAHDLRSPFNIFLGFTQMLVEELPTIAPDKIEHIALVLKNSAINVYGLLENLLEWSLLQQSITRFNPKQYVLKSKIEENIRLVLESAHKKAIEIKLDVPEELDVFADENMLGSTIRNLVSNAVKFTPIGGLIKIAARSVDSNAVEISVKDSGIGMGQDILDKLFQLEASISRNGTEGEPSTGLGLMLCKDFVDKHGGKIWAESEVDNGSTFYFEIPGNKIEP